MSAAHAEIVLDVACIPRSGRTFRCCVLALLLTFAPAACGPSGDAGRCPALAAPDVTSAEGWVGYLAAHRDHVAFVVDDGRGGRWEHRADVVAPMASASKALNMVAYARAVALGQLRPEEPVRVGDWERWQVAGPGESSHARSLDYLGIERSGTRAADPNRLITIDQLANVMIIFSDNAAPDYLRARLGDQLMRDAARDVDANSIELPSTTGFLLSLFAPELVPPGADRSTRRAAEWALAQRYAADPALKADLDTRAAPPDADEAAWAAAGPGGTARDLHNLWSSVARLSFPGADRARAIGEQRPNPRPGVLGRGLKSGRILGVVAAGFELRRHDGTVAVVSLLVEAMSPADTQRVGQANDALNDLLFAMADGPQMNALTCAATRSR